MTKAAQAKAWELHEWADGSHRSYPEPDEPTEPSALTYPILGSYWIGGNFLTQYQNGTNQQRMARRVINVINGWPELESARGVSNQAIAAAVKAINPNSKIVVYFDTERVYKSTTTDAFATRRAKIAAENWYVYSSGTTGTPLDSYFSSDGYAINPTEYCPQDSSGRYPMEWMADYEGSWIHGGQDGNTPAPDIDGVFWDNCLVQPRFNADWNRTGGSDNAATAAGWYRTGIANGISRYIANNPTKIALANIAELPNNSDPESNFPEYWRLAHGAVLEHAMGQDFAYEDFLDTSTFVSRVQTFQDAVLVPEYAMLNCCPYNYSATNYQEFRHALAFCLVCTDMALAWEENTHDHSDWPDYDEYDFDLGEALEPRQTAAESDGIWRRDFENGIAVWWPKGVTGSLSLGGTFYALQGNASAWLTPGQAVTSVTAPSARNGIILSRSPTA